MSGDQPNSPHSPGRTPGSAVDSSSQQLASTTAQSSLKSPKTNPTLIHPQGPRSQSLDPTITPIAVDPRDRPGSSRTKVVTLPPTSDTLLSSPTAAQRIPTSPTRAKTFPLPATTDHIEAESSLPPYRSPEPVFEPPEEHPEGFVPGVVEEHVGDFSSGPRSTPPASGYASPTGKAGDIDFDFSRWQADLGGSNGLSGAMEEMKDFEEDVGPQLGPGNTARRVLDQIHKHRLMRVSEITIPPRKPNPSQGSITNLNQVVAVDKSPTATTRPLSINPLSPTTTGSGSSSASSQPNGTLDFDHIRTEQDVDEALPGGSKDRDDWYFCWRCCHWWKIDMGGDSKLFIRRGEVMDCADTFAEALEWDLAPHDDEPFSQFDGQHGKEFLRNIESARESGDLLDRRHFHEIRAIGDDLSARTLERVDLGEDAVRFPHTIPGMEVDPKWFERDTNDTLTKLFVSCGTKEFIRSETGPVAGQIPPALLKAFIQEKRANPNVGATPDESVVQALQLLLTLLANPLFKGQRGWVKLENSRFQAKIGSTILSSMMLYMIGFGCREEKGGLEVGPYRTSSDISEDQVLQQDRYMMRTWIELALILQGWKDQNGIKTSTTELPIKVTYLDQVLSPNTMDRKPIPTFDTHPLNVLGMSKYDTADMIPTMYKWQTGCDQKRIPQYLGAVEKLSNTRVPGADDLQTLVATERSLNRYTDVDVQQAYEKLGYTKDYADSIVVEADEAPDDEILRMHRVAVQSVSDPDEKATMGFALDLIGRHRKNDQMRRLGGSGKSLMSVEEAYAALSAPSDSIDDGLIMQYEMAINEYPGKLDHYRSCLEIIAKAGGDERQGLKRYLETGSKEPEIVKRNDIPAGLQNIGNTCYLNSILQYLYSIKPLREAVLSFEQSTEIVKPEVDRSQRFVHQLRLLFLQLYKTEAASVRPDEELAYLAITRPEFDAAIETVEEPGSLIDNLPDVGSPASTVVNTPSNSRPGSPLRRSPSVSRSSVLGKRVSQDRESASPGERPKKSDAFEKLAEVDDNHDFEMVDNADNELSKPIHQDFTEDLTSINTDIPSSAPSTTADMDIDGLKLKSPELEQQDPIETDFAPPPGPPPLPPRPRRASKGTLNAGLKFGLQQDSAEVLINVLSQLETAFEPPQNADGSKGHNIIAELFSCEYRQQIVYTTEDGTVDAQTPVNSVFVHPIIGVEEEGKDLYDCLGELYLGGADIEYEGKKGHMMDLMDKFPPMLYIQMRRSQYDPVTRRERKTNTHVPFGQTLVMDRFLTDADPDRRRESIQLTREIAQLRARLHELQKEAPLSLPATFDHLHDALKSLQTDYADLEITPDFLNVLRDDRKEVEDEIQLARDLIGIHKARLNLLWSDEGKYEYELVSVFMHRGKTSGAGHYWTYQAHLPDHPGRFFKYNDETVTEVTADEVLQDRTGSDANPALLCYVRKGKDLVDTLHREVYEMEQAMKSTSDVEMTTDQVDAVADVEMGEQGYAIPDTEEPLIDLGEDTILASNDKSREKWIDDL